MKFINIYRMLLVAAAMLVLGGCSKADTEMQTDETINIELLFNVRDVKDNNILGNDSMGYVKGGEITAEYKGFTYKLDGDKDSFGTGLTLVDDSRGIPKQLGFGPIPGNVPAEEEQLIVNIGSDLFTILITNKYVKDPGVSPILKREVLFNGKNYYSGMTTIDLIVNTGRQSVYSK